MRLGGSDEDFNIEDGNKVILSPKVPGEQLVIIAPNAEQLRGIHEEYEAFLRETWLAEKRPIGTILSAREFDDVAVFVIEYLFPMFYEIVFKEYKDNEVTWILTNMTPNQQRDFNNRMYGFMRPNNIHRMLYRDEGFRKALENAIAGVEPPESDGDIDPKKKS